MPFPSVNALQPCHHAIRWPLGPVGSGTEKRSDFRKGWELCVTPPPQSLPFIFPKGHLKGVNHGHQQAHFRSGSILPPNELQMVFLFFKVFFGLWNRR